MDLVEFIKKDKFRDQITKKKQPSKYQIALREDNVFFSVLIIIF